MSMPKPVAAAAIVAVTGICVAGQGGLRPGQYETITEMNVGGKTVPPMKASTCLTAQDLKDMTKIFLRDAPSEGCRESDLVNAGDRMTFNMTCDGDGVRYTSRSEMTFGTDSYAGVTTMKSEAR